MHDEWAFHWAIEEQIHAWNIGNAADAFPNPLCKNPVNKAISLKWFLCLPDFFHF